MKVSTAQQYLVHSTAPCHARLRLAVGIATRGRPAVLADTLADLDAQSRPPDTILVAYAGLADIGDAIERFPHVRFVQCQLGLTKQRNAILDTLDNEDLVTFLDDDFYLHQEYLAVTEQVFVSKPLVVVATGTLLADGINGPGLNFQDAKALLELHRSLKPNSVLADTFNAYGCNMSFRLAPIRKYHLRFDENLPLYGWYEDVDFSRQLSGHGTIVKIDNAYGVHLGAKSGRQSGMRLGYSQVANPIYLARKRSVSWFYAIASMTSRSLKNFVRSAFPEPFVDRRGRLQGNLNAFRDLLSGTLSPTRILDF